MHDHKVAPGRHGVVRPSEGHHQDTTSGLPQSSATRV